MPDYKITAPDGNSYTVTAPDGATQDQVLQYAQANYQHPAVQSGDGLSHPDQGAGTTADQLPTATASPSADDYRTAGMNVPDKLRTSDESFFQKLNDVGNDAGDAIAHHLVNPIVGVPQLVGHGITAAADAALSPDNSVRQAIDATGRNYDQMAHNREATYQAATPTNAASVTGATLGEALPFVFEAPGKALQYVGDAAKILPKAGNIAARIGNKILSGAAQGATVAATQPVTSGPEGSQIGSLVSGQVSTPSFASQKLGQIGVGAATGGAIPLAGEVVGGVSNLAKHVINPQSIAAQNIARLVGSDPATLAKLDNASANNISGVTPTTAQAAPSASAVAAEKALGNTPAGKLQLVQRQTDNNAARLAVLQQHAGDDVAMQAAKDARTAAVKPFIDQHLQPATPATRWTAAAAPLDNVLSNPGRLSSGDFDALQQARQIVGKVKGGSMQEDDAVSALKDIEEGVTSQKAQNAFADTSKAVNQNMIDPSKVLQAAALTRNTGLGARPAVRDALDRITATINQSKNTNGLVPADVLDSVRQNINDFLVSPTGKRATPQEALGVAPIRDQLVQTIGQHAPGYADYLAAYAKHSQPINTMQAAQSILDRVNTRTLNSADAAPLSLNDINQGLKSIDKGRYGVSPQAQNDLQSIQDSLKREGISNSIRSPGSDTAYNINAQGALANNLLGPTLQGPTGKTRGIAALIGAALGEHIGGLPGAGLGAGIGTFINKGADVVNQRIMDAYTKGMLNPDEAAMLIRTYLKGNNSTATKLLARYPQWNALLSNASTQPTQKANP